MRDRIRFLEEEMQRKDAILLNMTEAMKALNASSREEAPESSVRPAPTRTPPGATEGEQEASGQPQERSWWRRVFGG